MTLRVIGIDPGSRNTGWGVVELHGTRLIHVASGTIEAQKQARTFPERLEIIYDGLLAAIDEYEPEAASLEGIFHYKNADSALKLGHARGVALLAARLRRLAIFEYQPTLVKQSVVGTGKAEKEQVQRMVCLLLGIPPTKLLDTSDALANAICHLTKADFLAKLG